MSAAAESAVDGPMAEITAQAYVVAGLEASLAKERRLRDEMVVRLARRPEGPSLARIAAAAGIASHSYVSRLVRAARSSS